MAAEGDDAMPIGRGAGAAMLALAVAGCGIVAPLYDRTMADAPHQSCAAVNGPHPLAGRSAAAPPQCFALFEENEAGARAAWSGGALTAGRTLVAVHQPAVAGCGGRFTHLTVSGASDGPGRAMLSAWDGIGRIGHGREATWGQGFASRTLALASVDSAILMPAGARVRVTAGRFDPASLCFKSY